MLMLIIDTVLIIDADADHRLLMLMLIVDEDVDH
jgi:hypothetical protein